MHEPTVQTAQVGLKTRTEGNWRQRVFTNSKRLSRVLENKFSSDFKCMDRDSSLTWFFELVVNRLPSKCPPKLVNPAELCSFVSWLLQKQRNRQTVMPKSLAHVNTGAGPICSQWPCILLNIDEPIYLLYFFYGHLLSLGVLFNWILLLFCCINHLLDIHSHLKSKQ